MFDDTYPCCGAIRLAERIKDHGELVLRNSNTRIGDTELKRDALLVHRNQSATEGNVSLPCHL